MAPQSSIKPKRRFYPMETLPNAQQIAAAKQDLLADSHALSQLKTLEDTALSELEEKRKQVYNRIGHLHVERDIVRANESAALSFIAPIRRLPLEIYREIFLIANSLDDLGHTPWHVSGVCRLWRRMALNIPNLWSIIRFHGPISTSPDIIRLWVDRSGPTVSLDIDIEILRRKRVHPSNAGAGGARQSSQHRRLVQGLMRLRNSPSHAQPGLLEDNLHRNATQWGHVALFYLAAQKHRWRKFVFESMEVPIEALQVLNGPFPRLEHFSVRCGDSTCRPTSWQWFINQSGGDHTPQLRNLTLDHVNFSWSSGIFTGLCHLRIHSPAPMIYAPHPASMDAVFGILLNNPHLQTLDLSVQALQNSILPHVEIVSLPELTSLSLEGAPHFISLLQHLKLENLHSVTIRFDVPQSLDFGESFRQMLERSNYPPIVYLNVQQPYRMQLTNLSYFEHLVELEELEVSRLPMEDVLLALDARADGTGSVPCPNLIKLSMSNCPGRRDMDTLVPTLVRFVERRTAGSQGPSSSNVINIASGGADDSSGVDDLEDVTGPPSSGIKELQSLKISNCGCVVSGQQEVWLKRRLQEFSVDEYCTGVYAAPYDWDIYSN